MAQLKDTVISGSLRVTDTIFSTNLNLSSLTASYAVVTDANKNLTSKQFTNANTANTIVSRDGSGNFSAGTITATLSGNASSATKVKVTNLAFPSSGSQTYYPTLAGSTTTGNQDIKDSAHLYLYENTTASYLNIGSGSSSGGITIHNANGKYADIVSSAFGANRTLTLPNQTGTIALLTKTDINALINLLDEGTSVLTGNDYIITQYVSGGTTTTTYHRRAAKNVRVGGLTTARSLWGNSFDGTADVSGPIVIKQGTIEINTSANNGNTGSSSIYTGIGINDKNGYWYSNFYSAADSDGTIRSYLECRNKKTDGTVIGNAILAGVKKDGTQYYSVSNAAAFRSAISAPSTTGSGASGTWGISISGTATRANYLTCSDTRSTALNPNDLTATTIGLRLDFKQKSITGLTANYSGVLSFRPYGSASDWSGGPAHQLAFDENGLHRRKSTGDTTWDAWKTLLDSSNYSSYALPLSGGTVSGIITLKNSSINLKSATNGLSENVSRYLRVIDNNGYDFALFQGAAKTDGSIYAFMGVNNRKTDGTAVGWSGISINQTKANNTVTYSISNPENFTWSLLHVADPSNLNNAKRMGNFKISNTTTNTPVSGMWGATWNIVDDSAIGNNNNAGSTWQLVFKSASNDMWLRNITNEGSWSEYAKFLSDKNYSSYALPLSGGTLSGNIYVSKAGETYVRATNTTTSCSIELNSYTDKHGLWSNGYWNGSTYTASSKWLIYRGTDGNVVVNGNCTGTAGSVAWANTGHPSTFPPSSHTHPVSELTWGGSVNLSCTGTNAEWSIDMASSATNSYWHVWSAIKGGSCLQCFNDDRHVWAYNLQGAVWNDYAEYRKVEEVELGRVVIENSDKQMKLCEQRLAPGAKITSDTFGISIGKSKEYNIPIAVSGRVLAFPYRNKNEYPLGAAVCSAPNGTVDIMTREEIMMYPERILGTVSEIPDYDEWAAGGNGGSEKNNTYELIPVKGRIWIYVR